MNSKLEKKFVECLRSWNESNPREMPWSGIKDPYKVWISEVILQQTRVAQGWDYYLNFIETFPNVKALAQASQDKVLKQWEGLGYYSRARNLHKAANQILENHGGKFPTTYDDILKLSGIGPYTAAAISSFAFDQAYPVLDGNVSRVASRYFSIASDILKNSTKKEMLSILNRMIVAYDNPSEFNQALMNFGATQCIPQNPKCDICSMNKYCIAHNENHVSELPFKAKKIKKRKRYFHFFDLIDKTGNRIIHKRDEQGIWAGLYQFILVENSSKTKLNLKRIEKLLEPLAVFERQENLEFDRFEFKHQLTHQTIFATVYRIHCDDISLKKPNLILTNSFEEYAFPRLLDLYLQSN